MTLTLCSNRKPLAFFLQPKRKKKKQLLELATPKEALFTTKKKATLRANLTPTNWVLQQKLSSFFFTTKRKRKKATIRAGYPKRSSFTTKKKLLSELATTPKRSSFYNQRKSSSQELDPHKPTPRIALLQPCKKKLLSELATTPKRSSFITKEKATLRSWTHITNPQKKLFYNQEKATLKAGYYPPKEALLQPRKSYSQELDPHNQPQK
jgi:hypothetical protein